MDAGGVDAGAFVTVRAGRRVRDPPRMTRSNRSFFDIQTSSARGWTAGAMVAEKQLLGAAWDFRSELDSNVEPQFEDWTVSGSGA